jgi:hypothetical protein
MTDNPNWPNAIVGNKDSILAIGAVSVNYARLEFAMTAMFATISGCAIQVATLLVQKIPTPGRPDLMRKLLAMRQAWPTDVRDRCAHFINGFGTLADNRNLLMHSSVAASIEQAITLYKTTKQGTTELCVVSVPELRQVADDMLVYFYYGLRLSNVINFELLGIKPHPGENASWPDTPPLPSPLKYSARPLPVP